MTPTSIQPSRRSFLKSALTTVGAFIAAPFVARAVSSAPDSALPRPTVAHTYGDIPAKELRSGLPQWIDTKKRFPLVGEHIIGLCTRGLLWPGIVRQGAGTSPVLSDGLDAGSCTFSIPLATAVSHWMPVTVGMVTLVPKTELSRPKVRAKELEYRPHWDGAVAFWAAGLEIGIIYRCDLTPWNGPVSYLVRGLPSPKELRFDTMDEAKAAAQAHWESTVLGALHLEGVTLDGKASS